MLINLTPHNIDIHASTGTVTVLPSGIVARVQSKSVQTGEVEVEGIKIPLFSLEYGEVEGLPPLPQEGETDDVLVVSGLVAAACPRRDVFSPGELVRNEAGQPVGCLGLKRSM